MRTNNTIQTFWIGLGSLSNFAVSILSAAILSRYLNVSDYGTYKQILYIFSVLQIVFSAGLPSVFSYFLPQYSLSEGRDIVTKLTKMLFLSGLFFSIFLYSFSGIIANVLKNQELSIALKLFSPIPFFTLPTMGIQAIYATYKNTFISAIYDVLSRTIIFIAMVIPIAFFNKDYKVGIIYWSFASFLTLIMGIYFKSIPFRKIIRVKTTLSYKSILQYSFPIVFASFWGIAARASDQFYISRFFGTETFAIFSNGFIELPFVTMITSATAAVLLPQFTTLIKEKNDINALLVLWRSALFKSATIIYPIIVFFLFNANDIIKILYSERYQDSAIYFQIALVINFFNIVIFAPLLFAINKTKFYSRLHLISAILSWSLGYISILIFNSPLAIAITSVLISIAKVIIAFRIISKYFEISIFELLPVITLARYLLHSILIIISTKLLLWYFMISIDYSIVVIFINLFAYVLLLLITAKYFKINYIEVLLPTINKYYRKDVKKI